MAQLTKAQLEQLVEQLRSENTGLRDELQNVSVQAAVPDATGSASSPKPHKPRGRGWTVLATALILIGTLLAPVAIVANWAKLQLADTTTFVDTFAPLAKDPAVQSYVTTEVVAAIDNHIDIDKLTSDVFDSIAGLGLGPAATTALNSFKGVAANGIRSVMTNAVSAFVQSDAFAEVWRQALTTSHNQLIAAMQNDPNAALTINGNGEVGIALGPIIDQVKQVLVSKGVTFAANIPEINQTIVIAQSDSVVQAQLGYNLAIAVGAWLPWIALLFLVAGVLVARRRSLALIWAAVALALAMFLTVAGVGVGHLIFIGAVSPAYIPSDVADTLYTHILALVSSSATSIAILAIVIAVVAWLAGPYRFPRAARALAGSGAAWLRGAAAHRGFTTGRFGEWVYKLRYAIRAAVAVIGAAIILLTRPITPAGTFWTLFGAVIVLIVVELVQRPVDEIVSPEKLTPEEASAAAVSEEAASVAAADASAAEAAAAEASAAEVSAAGSAAGAADTLVIVEATPEVAPRNAAAKSEAPTEVISGDEPPAAPPMK
ncbi:hypothetical protein [Subtercola lobariae]|uniref:Uncharacterized protein n=1 Tax=Subtercola lobariae TaxID=1588641 RepID=A0A917BD81_9MICO|nr:hypothetical protein [Subtercola lobariae]GGF35861.1 hypothetical protein GCM10011399_31060 [Subtercola lobariae]